jgi:hypothetical protein
MSNVKFRPVRGLESNILEAPIREGRVYFATDSGKMYMDKDGLRIPIGGGTSGIHYGNKIFNNDSEEVGEFIFSLYNIEGNEIGSNNLTIPKINDLILNIPDGSFYRVIEVDSSNDKISCTRLTIAGSGNGNNGSNSNKGSATLTRLTPNNITILSGKEHKVGLNYVAYDGSGNVTTGNVKYTVIVNNNKIEEGYMQQGDKYFDVTEYLVKETNTIAVTVYADVGAEDYVPYTMRWEIKTTKLLLT